LFLFYGEEERRSFIMAAGAAAGATAASAAARNTSSYRVKFRREEFLELLKSASPERVYHVNRIHFFAYDGFVAYSQEIKKEDLKILRLQVIEAIEFSNEAWREAQGWR
jgi:hypothetical protein